MKKKIVAALCAFALAMAVPAAAFADISPERVTTDGDTTTVDMSGMFTDGVYNPETGGYDPVDVLECVEIEGAENVTINTGEDIDWDAYDDDAIAEYNKMLDQVWADRGEYLFQFEINGDVVGDGPAVVTFQLNADQYGGKVITYYILHHDGSIQSKVVRVNADGTVTIWMDSFSIITFMDVDGLTKYENMVEPQDGELLSPKTGN